MAASIRQSSLRLGFSLIVFFGLSVITASAHNVVSGVYAEGMTVEGEIGFSNGEMAKAGIPVKVFNEGGDLLAEIALEEGGIFSYEAKAAAPHLFKSNLSSGHIAEMRIEADELSGPVLLEALSQNAVANTKQDGKVVVKKVADADVMLSSNISAAQLESIVRSAVAQQVKPLQKELRAYKEKVMFRDITGGLGFIFGLFGVAAWMASKRKSGDENATVS